MSLVTIETAANEGILPIPEVASIGLLLLVVFEVADVEPLALPLIADPASWLDGDELAADAISELLFVEGVAVDCVRCNGLVALSDVDCVGAAGPFTFNV